MEAINDKRVPVDYTAPADVVQQQFLIYRRPQNPTQAAEWQQVATAATEAARRRRELKAAEALAQMSGVLPVETEVNTNAIAANPSHATETVGVLG